MHVRELHENSTKTSRCMCANSTRKAPMNSKCKCAEGVVGGQTRHQLAWTAQTTQCCLCLSLSRSDSKIGGGRRVWTQHLRSSGGGDRVSNTGRRSPTSSSLANGSPLPPSSPSRSPPNTHDARLFSLSFILLNPRTIWPAIFPLISATMGLVGAGRRQLPPAIPRACSPDAESRCRFFRRRRVRARWGRGRASRRRREGWCAAGQC